MKIRLMISSVVIAIPVAASCSAPPSERAESTAQGITDTTDAGTDGEAASCAHPICAPGVALAATCDACATKLCAWDPYCCHSAWDETCVSEVGSICGQSCTAPPPPPPPVDAGTIACLHPVCTVGVPLLKSCDACATKLCALDPYCCSTYWDTTCVGEVGSICGQSCK